MISESFNIIYLLSEWAAEISVALLAVSVKMIFNFTKKWMTRDHEYEDAERYVSYLDRKIREYNRKYDHLKDDILSLLEKFDELDNHITHKNREVIALTASIKSQLAKVGQLKTQLQKLHEAQLIESVAYLQLLNSLDDQFSLLRQNLLLEGLASPSLHRIKAMLQSAYNRITKINYQ